MLRIVVYCFLFEGWISKKLLKLFMKLVLEMYFIFGQLGGNWVSFVWVDGENWVWCRGGGIFFQVKKFVMGLVSVLDWFVVY